MGFSLTGLKSTLSYFEKYVAENQNWRAADEYIAGKALPGDIYVLCADYAADPFTYYAGNIPEMGGVYGWSRLRKGIVPIAFQQTASELRPVWADPPPERVEIPMASDARLWFIESHCDIGGGETTGFVTRAITRAGWERQSTTSFRGIDVHGFALPAR